ncbi:DNA methyltransferase [Levilinea saccharolytica]|uniref:DNA methyltransferase n=1 Tax=Levilinea saccharolytica TaxID=229921 RepID=UPI0009467673|nr:DNA methyltransferase [Levilinea saccharolytica]GAP16380.1 DNA methylase [Levilinea saccharolytica]
MPKQKPSPHQSPLFKRSVPRMPDGYYSSGPNPNLRKFVEEHATPYDPEHDDYNVPPFDVPITTTKATAIYNMHTYWSKKPHDAIQQYIRHYTQPGDLVLDPFCGSGGTALAALMEGRAAIAIDLSPAATFITKNYCTPVDVDELQRAFEELKAKVKPEMDWLYETRCDRCDGRATTAYTVFSTVFQCSRCLEKVAYYDCPEIQSQTSDGKLKTIRICPSCLKHGHQEEINTSGKRLESIPVEVSYICEEGCKPQRGERSHIDPNAKKRKYFELFDLKKIKEIESKSLPYWYPHNNMNNTPDKELRWGLLWRPYHGDLKRVDQFFTKRNLWAFALFLSEADKSLYSNVFRLLLTGSCLHGSKMSHHKEAGGGIMAGTYYLPQMCKERNVYDLLERKFVDIRNAEVELSKSLSAVDVSISTQSATNIGTIPNDSIDYIFTDPPYGEKVQYGELNFVWEAWLKLDTSWQDNEIVINKIRGKTDVDWAQLMRSSFEECFRVLKPNRWITLCYHDTSEGTWELVQDFMTEIGFIPDKSDSTLFIDTGQKSYNQYTAEKVTKRDLVINFRKPRPGEVAAKVILTGDEDATSFFEKARAILIEALEAHPGSSADRLYDELVSRMVRRGEFQRHNFDELLRSVAEPVTEPVMKNLFEQKEADLFGSHEAVRWYLLDTAGLVDEAEGKKESAAAQRLEAFMQRWLREHPGESGVHYSDLFEQYLPISDKPRRLLQEWLPEFFFKTAEGTWRPAKDDEERQQKLGLRSTGVLRHIKRFANALSEGVPPGERDKPANPATLADWIYQCRRAGLYDLGRILYEKGGLRFDGLGEELQLQVEEDYQICVKRGIQTSPKKTRKKPDQPQLEGLVD